MSEAICVEQTTAEDTQTDSEFPAWKRIERLAKLAASISEEIRHLTTRTFLGSAYTFPLQSSNQIDFYEEVIKFEKKLIADSLDETGGNQARAARLLGLKATTLHSKIKQYGLSR